MPDTTTRASRIVEAASDMRAARTLLDLLGDVATDPLDARVIVTIEGSDVQALAHVLRTLEIRGPGRAGFGPSSWEWMLLMGRVVFIVKAHGAAVVTAQVAGPVAELLEATTPAEGTAA